MGTDDLHHKRKAKKARELVRRKARRASYAKVLIVCEGEKTEPNYFKGMIDHYELNSANVEIADHRGADPIGIFTHARQRYREMKDMGDPFDRIYCVFDKDTHAKYQESLDAIARATPPKTYFAINSVPCFEYWLLLHFTYTCKPYQSLADCSACGQISSDLKHYLPDYTKGERDTFSKLIDQLQFAKENAARALREAESNRTDNPSTKVHELVKFLQNINQKA
uniref:RloB-like protein n=1 Tax=Candidatus Kentrum sp. LPFa TaxID=2126335 RepID=A0A450WGJ5_9GAMM|nr:MAG: RloB-like protein [Candidatus Kentron sp. LPFa]